MSATGVRLILQTRSWRWHFPRGHAQEGAPAKGGLEAKLEYCKTCHGLSGQGYRGYFPMPRLAGQQPQYIETQLRAFIERRRTNPIMFNVAHVLSPSMVSALATHFKSLNPKPIGGAPRGSIAIGKQIYEEGLPGIQRAGLLGLSRHGRQGPERNSATRGSALRVHGRPVDRLEDGARSGHGGRYIGDHGADGAQPDAIAGRGGRGLCQLSAVSAAISYAACR